MPAPRKTTTRKASSSSSAAKKTAATATDTVVNMNNKAMQDMQQSLTSEAQKAQEQFYTMGRESAEQFAKSADSAGQTINEVSNICRENIEACIESGNIAASIAKEVSEELAEYASHTASESVELNKALFACRTLNDVVELQNKVVQSSVENTFEQWSRLSSSLFESFNEIAEPINQRIAESTDQVSKIMSNK